VSPDNLNVLGARVLLLKSISVVMLCLLFIQVGNWYYSLRLAPKDEFLKNKKLFYALKSAPNILFLGDSHLEERIMPEKVPKDWLNISFAGEKYGDFLCKLYYLESIGKLPKTLVLQADPHKVSNTKLVVHIGRYIDLVPGERLCKAADIQQKDLHWYRFYEYIPAASPDNRFLIMEVVFHDFGHFVRSKLAQANGKAVPNSEVDVNKRHWDRVSRAQRISECTNKAREEFGAGTIGKQHIRNLESIVSFCKEKSIRLVLLRTPITKDYREVSKTYLPNGYDGYFPAIPYDDILDARTIFDNHQGYFSDFSHLNADGVLAFSMWLNEQPELRKTNR
jgi:hypothetical protein